MSGVQTRAGGVGGALAGYIFQLGALSAPGDQWINCPLVQFWGSWPGCPNRRRCWPICHL